MTAPQTTFAQGLQLFFIERILREKHTMATEAHSKRGIRFFAQWSQIVCRGRETDGEFPLTVRVPPDFGRTETQRSRPDVPPEAEAEVEAKGSPIPDKHQKLILPFIPPAYRQAYEALFDDPGFSPLWRLLADEDLGSLMQIAYPAETAERVAVAAGATKDADIIREAVARQLGDKKPDAITEDDCAGVTELSLEGTDFADTRLLKVFTNLEKLNLDETQVSDLIPLKELTSLQRLFLSQTQVSDLTPLKGLTSLQRLALRQTQVSEEQVAELKKALPKLKVAR